MIKRKRVIIELKKNYMWRNRVFAIYCENAKKDSYRLVEYDSNEGMILNIVESNKRYIYKFIDKEVDQLIKIL